MQIAEVFRVDGFLICEVMAFQSWDTRTMATVPGPSPTVDRKPGAPRGQVVDRKKVDASIIPRKTCLELKRLVCRVLLSENVNRSINNIPIQ
jgi:hypothetical protein